LIPAGTGMKHYRNFRLEKDETIEEAVESVTGEKVSLAEEQKSEKVGGD